MKDLWHINIISVNKSKIIFTLFYNLVKNNLIYFDFFPHNTISLNCIFLNRYIVFCGMVVPCLLQLFSLLTLWLVFLSFDFLTLRHLHALSLTQFLVCLHRLPRYYSHLSLKAFFFSYFRWTDTCRCRYRSTHTHTLLPLIYLLILFLGRHLTHQ